MTSFAETASSFIADRSDAAERRLAWSLFESLGLPSPSDEVWRYAPLGDLDLNRFEVAASPQRGPDSAFAAQLCERAGLVVRVVDGFGVSVGEATTGVSVEFLGSQSSLNGESFLQRYEGDTFALLNVALAPGTTVIRVEAGVDVSEPIVVLNESSASASFSRTQIVVGRGASVTVVEYFEGGKDGLVVPVSEYLVEDNASL
jgi:Fe-S cluster assembly protein SufD